MFCSSVYGLSWGRFYRPSKIVSILQLNIVSTSINWIKMALNVSLLFHIFTDFFWSGSVNYERCVNYDISISRFSFASFDFLYFETLLLDTYTFIIVTSSYDIDHFVIMRYASLPLILLLVLKSTHNPTFFFLFFFSSLSTAFLSVR